MTRLLLAATALLAVAAVPSSAHPLCNTVFCVETFDICAKVQCHPCVRTPDFVACL